MIKRIVLVAAFTGTSQLISLFTISYVIRNLGEEVGGYIGVIDSTILIIAAVASFGIQLSVNRNVAIQKNWKSNYRLAQSARLTIGLLIILYGLIAYSINKDVTNLIYLAAPLIALNGDYALYGNGKPVHAAMLSFFRVAIPNLGVIFTTMFFSIEVVLIYMALVSIGIFIAGFLASYFNEVDYFFAPRRDFHKVYRKYYKVGLFQFSSAFLLTGIIFAAKGFYDVALLGLVYGVLKYFEVFKGGLRIMVQAFFKELKNENVNIKIDKAGILLSSLMVIPTIIYTKTSLNILYDNKYDGIEWMFVIFGIAMWIDGLKTSADARILLLKKDNVNLYSYLIAVATTITLTIIFSYTEFLYYGIPISILVGETILLISLGLNLDRLNFFMDRLKFFIKLVPFLAVALGMKYFIGDNVQSLILSMGIYCLSVLFVFRKLIFDTSFIIKHRKG